MSILLALNAAPIVSAITASYHAQHEALSGPMLGTSTIASTSIPQISDTVIGRLLPLMLGSAMGFLLSLWPYVLAIAFITSLVYFFFRAFKFFKH